jgi:2-polyprenyl-3-methyl-5-hydroxy-6-metoxy-1,4-benzoquinol methylase
MTVEHLGNDWETIECDLCGSSQTTGYLRIAPYQFKGDPHYILVKCSSCQLVFLNPRPGPRLIGQYYGSDYYAHAGMNNRKPNLKARIRNRFLDGLGGYSRSSLSGRLIHSFVPRGVVDVIIPSQQRGRLLDVGCGDGERVDWYQKRGFEAYGVEVSERAVASARNVGLNVRQGTLTDACYPDSSFDVVLMAHVLEHTHSPGTYLREAYRLLKPGGMLAVAVPNIESHSADVFKACWRLLMPPIHLYHFSVQTLSRFLSESGFKVESIVGKTVYPIMIKRSIRITRESSGVWPSLMVSVRSGLVASGLQQLLFGPRKCDAITAYCSKR